MLERFCASGGAGGADMLDFLSELPLIHLARGALWHLTSKGAERIEATLEATLALDGALDCRH